MPDEAATHYRSGTRDTSKGCLKDVLYGGSIMRIVMILSLLYLLLGYLTPDPEGKLFAVMVSVLVFCFSVPALTILNKKMSIKKRWILAALAMGVSVYSYWYACRYAEASLWVGDFVLMIASFTVGIFVRKVYLKLQALYHAPEN